MMMSENKIKQEISQSEKGVDFEEIILKQNKEIKSLKKMIKNQTNSLCDRYHEINKLNEVNKTLKEHITNKETYEKIKTLKKENILLNNQISNLKNLNQMHKRDKKRLRKMLRQNGLINDIPVPKIVKEKVFTRDQNICLKCWTTENLSIDHIVPRIKGGNNDENNLQTLCRECNVEKGIDIIDYRRSEEESLVLDFYMNGVKVKKISEKTRIKRYKIYQILHKFIDLGVIDNFNLKQGNRKLYKLDIEKIKNVIRENQNKLPNKDRLTLEEIGNLFDVSVSTISRIKNNKYSLKKGRK